MKEVFIIKLLIKFINWLDNLYYEICKDEYENLDPNVSGSLKHIWGIKSGDDLSTGSANLYTMNDIDITYDKDENTYMLGIETVYIFKSKQDECNYLLNLLEYFTSFMIENNYDTNNHYNLFMSNIETPMQARHIEELYTNFKIFVAGFCELYNKVKENDYNYD